MLPARATGLGDVRAGEPARPVWLGFWYSSEDPRRQTAPAKGGSPDEERPKVVFDDEAGKESIRIEDKDGQKVEWDPKAGKITIEATAKVVVKAPEVEVGAGVILTGVSTERAPRPATSRGNRSASAHRERGKLMALSKQSLSDRIYNLLVAAYGGQMDAVGGRDPGREPGPEAFPEPPDLADAIAEGVVDESSETP